MPLAKRRFSRFYAFAISFASIANALVIQTSACHAQNGATAYATQSSGQMQIVLNWNASKGAATYNVYRGTASGGESSTAIATGLTTTKYTNTGVTAGTAYYYKVKAVNSYGMSGYSNEAYATPDTVSGLTLNPIKIVGGHSCTGTVALAAAAPAGGLPVALSSSESSLAATPPSVTVAAGAKTATFQITSSGVQATTNVTISATADSSTQSASLEIAFEIFRISFSPDTVAGGHTSTGTVTLSAPAPAALTIDFKSSDESIVAVPKAIVIAAGATQGLFKCYTVKPTVATVVSIEAYANSAGHLSENMTVDP